ncbi:purine and uridine phosphorylase [Aspergillus carlsbadensis]|nr:purine and uridine phosphorylase [Aspergillus carlsbadensis]
MSQQIPLSHEDYTVGWISALPIEMAAAQALLDEIHPDLPIPHSDNNSYVLGRIGKHNVVVACLPSGIYGTSSATAVATQLLSSFPSIRFGLMVGIGGGVPSKDADIRLGDVVVSKPTATHGGVVQYDFGKATTRNGGIFQRTGLLNSPPPVLLTAVSKLQAIHLTQGKRFVDFLAELERRRPSDQPPPFARPATDDCLYFADYAHAELYSKTCHGREDGSIVHRIARKHLNVPVIHYGLIASGNQVIKDARLRSKLSEELGVYCVEMEAAGLMNNYPCLVIRGICDYAGSHKNKAWQGYAAATAAAFAKELLLVVPVSQTRKAGLARDALAHAARHNPAFRVPLHLRNVPAIHQFLGREDELQKLWNGLGPKSSPLRKVAVLDGLGGIGKTQLAIRFARTHNQDFSAIFWISSEDQGALMRSLASAFLRVPDSTHRESSQSQQRAQPDHITAQNEVNRKAEAMLNWLSLDGNSGWLLIFDNAIDDYYDHDGDSPQNMHGLSHYFPAADHGSILITTRSSRMRDLGTHFPVQKLGLQDATQLLLVGSGRKQPNISKQAPDADPEIALLASRLDGLPLAITIAGSYIRQSGITFTKYLEYYTSSWRELMCHSDPPHFYFQGNIMTTWMVTHRKVQQQHPDAAELLILLATFDHRDIWFELVQACGQASGTPTWFRNSLASEMTFVTTLMPLINFSLVEMNQRGGSYSMHPVVQEWCLHVLNENSSTAKMDQLKAMALSAVGHGPTTRNESEQLRLQQRLLSHADQMLRLIRGWDIPAKPGIFDAIHDLGYVYLSQGKLKEAEEAYCRALIGREALLGSDHVDTLDTVNNLGVVYTNLGNLHEADRMSQRALEGRQKALGHDHISTLQSVNNLGYVCTKQENLEKAEELYKQALAGFERSIGPDDTATLDTINNLGLLYTMRGDLGVAEKLYQRALRGYERVLGPDHTSTLLTVFNLGSLYRTQGKRDEARKIFKRCLAGYLKAMGARHTLTLTIAHTLRELEERADNPPETAQADVKAGASVQTGIDDLIPAPTPHSQAIAKASYSRYGVQDPVIGGWWEWSARSWRYQDIPINVAVGGL